MLIQTSELTGAALAWAVGMAEGYELSLYGVDPSIRARVPGLGVHAPWRPDRYWNQGGPIIDREKIELLYYGDMGMSNAPWEAQVGQDIHYIDQGPGEATPGTTPLIAAMRCYVGSKLGDEVDVPDELIK